MPLTSALSQKPDIIYQIPSGRLFESILFFEGNLLRLGAWLPDPVLFAAFNAFPWLVLALSLPPLLRRLGATRPMSWLALVLCAMAPASVWWSFAPVRILAFTAAGCYLLFLARDQLAQRGSRRALFLGVLLTAGAAVFLARLVTNYVPWSITIGVPLVLAVGVFLVRDPTVRRVGLVTIGLGAAFALLLLVGTFWENLDALRAQAATVYPGLRRTSGAAQPIYQLFGAPALYDLKRYPPNPAITNQSEITSAFLICGVWAALLWGAARARSTAVQRAAMATLGIGVVVLVAWAVVSWGSIGPHVPALNRVLPVRVAQTVGYPATLLVCLVLSRLPRGNVRTATVCAAVCGLVTAYAGSTLIGAPAAYAGTAVPAVVAIPTRGIWISSLVTAGLIWVVTRYPERWLPVVLVAVVTSAVGARVNPVVFGLGDVRNSQAATLAQGFADRAEADGGLWAADTLFGSALLVANGVPSVSGYQVTGPDEDKWRILDPTGRYKDAWNRGVSYVYFIFAPQKGVDTRRAPFIGNASTVNQIVVYADPCWLAASKLSVAHLLAETPVTSPCAKPVSTFEWNGATQHVYDLVPRNS